MDALVLARVQFGVTTVYHFLFVPVTIGLSLLVAILQTAWVRSDDVAYLRATRFWGKLFLINIAMGVVTGLVQEFQFGMNWSAYSRFVGDIFGAPLALEALIAFFLESTFVGVWIFGWDRLSRGLHLTAAWCVAVGAVLSAYFILAANSFMQHPVGFTINRTRNRAELRDFWAVITNKVVLATFPHTIFAAWATGGMLMIAVSAWHLSRDQHTGVMRPSLRLGLVAALVGALGFLVSGDLLGKVMTETQPMKMAAAEALYRTEQPAGFSLLTIGTLNGSKPVYQVTVPRLLSFLATGSFDGRVQGINDLQSAYQKRFGPGDYRPYIPVAYWGFRAMVGAGVLITLVALAGLWLTRRGRLPRQRWIWITAIWAVVLPFVGNSTGWIFTEMARQPWIVFSQLRTARGVSPAVGSGTVLTSLVVFTVLYGVLAIVEFGLMLTYARAAPPEVDPDIGRKRPGDDEPLAFAY